MIGVHSAVLKLGLYKKTLAVQNKSHFEGGHVPARELGVHNTKSIRGKGLPCSQPPFKKSTKMESFRVDPHTVFLQAFLGQNGDCRTLVSSCFVVFVFRVVWKKGHAWPLKAM